MKSYLRLSTLLLASLLLFGCTTANYRKASDTSTTLRDAASSIDDTLAPLDAVTIALSDLLNLPKADRASQFRTFSRAVTALESQATQVGTQSSSLQASGAAYLKQWDEELATIENDEIQDRSLERKDAVEARIKKVRENYLQVSAQLSPFLSDLRDLRTALSTDLTAGGINSVRGLERKVITDADELRASLIQLSVDFKSLGVSLSTRTT